MLDSGEHVVTALHGIEEEEYLETHSLRERFEDRINMMHEEFNLSLKHLLEAINENSYEICTSLPDFHYGYVSELYTPELYAPSFDGFIMRESFYNNY